MLSLLHRDTWLFGKPARGGTVSPQPQQQQQQLGVWSSSAALRSCLHQASLDGRDTLVHKQPKPQGLLVARDFWTVGRMNGGRCYKPSWALAALFVAATLLMLTSRGASSSRKMTQTSMSQVTATAAGPGPSLTDDLPGFQAVADFLASERTHVWILSLVGSVAVGLSGVFPLLVIPIEAGAALKTEAGCQRLKQLLSFAIGGLLGDVFLHLLPEVWALSSSSAGKHNHYMSQGLWVISGLLAFLLLEKMFPDQSSSEDHTSDSDLNSNLHTQTSTTLNGKAGGSVTNGHKAESWTTSKQQDQQQKIKTSGYLNLLANCIDNFTHGLAVAGSFLVSKKVGLDPQLQFRFVSCSDERIPYLPLPQNNVKTKILLLSYCCCLLEQKSTFDFPIPLCSMVIFDEQQPYFWLLACDSQDQRALQPFFSFSGTQSLCCFPFSLHSVTAK
uniref:Zinc transporter ZIP13 n=1 Tax=Oryzias sinensis TaxID=183150 RepID=A0A8C7YS02_9TELE